jgi:hypothetical protein
MKMRLLRFKCLNILNPREEINTDAKEYLEH